MSPKVPAEDPIFDAFADQVLVRLRALVAARGLRNIDLAERLQVTPPYITGMLSGRRRLTMRFLAHVLDAMDATLEDLVQA